MKRIGYILIFAALLVIPVVLFLLPANFFDHGQSICISQLLLEKECPGCGLTRGIQHLIHLDAGSAWQFNKLSFLILPIGIWFWIRWILSYYRKIFNNNPIQ